MKKKILSILFVATAIQLCACGSADKKVEQSSESISQTVENTMSVVNGPAITVENSISSVELKESTISSEPSKSSESTISQDSKDEQTKVSSKDSSESSVKSSSTTKKDETVKYGLPEEWDRMDDAVYSILTNMEENDVKYNSKDNEFFWSSVFYLVSCDGYDSPAADIDDSGVIKLPEHYVKQFAASMFGDFDGNIDLLPAIPESIGYVTNNGDGTYSFYCGDFADTKIDITECVHKGDVYTLKVKYITEGKESNKYTITLKDSTFDDGKPWYHWSITNIK